MEAGTSKKWLNCETIRKTEGALNFIEKSLDEGIVDHLDDDSADALQILRTMIFNNGDQDRSIRLITSQNLWLTNKKRERME